MEVVQRKRGLGGKGLLEGSAEAREGSNSHNSLLEWVLFQATALAVTNW